jgi:hypothetical protein
VTSPISPDGPTNSKVATLGGALRKTAQADKSPFRRSASERMPRNSARGGGIAGNGPVSPRSSPSAVDVGMLVARTPGRSGLRRESSIADHGAQEHLLKCCTDLLRAIDNFERKGRNHHTQTLDSQMAGARTAVETLNRHLWTVAQGLHDDVSPSNEAHGSIPEDNPVGSCGTTSGQHALSSTISSFTIDVDALTPLVVAPFENGADDPATWGRSNSLPSATSMAYTTEHVVGTPPPPARFAASPLAAAPVSPAIVPPPPSFDTGHIEVVADHGSRTFDDDDDEVFV